MKWARKLIKLQSLRALRRGGMYWLAAHSRLRRSRLLILCYHGVSFTDEHEWRPAMYMRADTLRSRLRWLRKIGAAILPLDEAVTRLRDGTLPFLATAITFDDGFHDFSALAVPLLEEFRAPATVYLTTWYCGRHEPVFNPMCGFLLWRARHRGVVNCDGVVPSLGSLDVSTREARSAAWARIRAAIDGRSLDEATVLRDMGRLCADDYDELLEKRVLQLMTEDEVRALPRGLIDVQLHTHRHKAPLDPALFGREIRDNRAAIGQILRDKIPRVHFAYPSGVTHPSFLPWLREAGVATATTCERGLASTADEPLMLPRLTDTDAMGDIEFGAWVCGLRGWMRR